MTDITALMVRRLRDWSDPELNAVTMEMFGSLTRDDFKKLLDGVGSNANEAADLLTAQAARIKRLEHACRTTEDAISQTLGKALNFPWYKDDQEHFPGTTEANGVYIGEHVAETLADAAAGRIAELMAELDGAVEVMRGAPDE